MSPADQLQQAAAVYAVIDIAVVLASIAAAWWALQQVRWETFLKDPASPRSKWLVVMLAAVVGYQFARFILDYMAWSSQLDGFF